MQGKSVTSTRCAPLLRRALPIYDALAFAEGLACQCCLKLTRGLAQVCAQVTKGKALPTKSPCLLLYACDLGDVQAGTQAQAQPASGYRC